MFPPFLERLPLSRGGLDRDYLARDEEGLLARLRSEPGTRYLPIFRDEVLLETGGPVRLRLLPSATAPAGLELYLGRLVTSRGDDAAGTRIVAVVLDEEARTLLAPAEQWVSLRTLAHELDAVDASAATEAIALANWHASHTHSPRSGAAVEVEKAGWVLRDSEERHELFPRTDAAIIVGITDADDRLLLGSNAMWASNRYSLLAGFVEPGESLEEAVIREVFEESGVRVKDPVYLGSQPWPFPASLMMGFRATVDGATAELAPDGTEILDLRWFSRDELRDALDEILLPGPTSIARTIIEEWYGGPLESGQW
ncbi:NAD(+) diphosphatase [Arenivirga flava]|uniref:NAD(+) diphosphatase n=1 Tax=Arenivirga flava TaxID=1930060 RepID=A0AA37UFU4_9MICO|nr:NAD(+) diphosphatase [Arenivirga flava]GMA29808.1 NTP pyrophosphohydrolase [Arenivirga flava]